MASGTKNFVRDFLGQNRPAAEPAGIQPIRPDGSDRMFSRVTVKGGGPGLVVMENPPRDALARRENLAWLKIGRHLFQKGAPVPEIYRWDLQRGRFIMADLGETNLCRAVSTGGDPLPLYEKVLEHLLHQQIHGAEGFNPSWCCQTARYDRAVMRRFESDYFRDAFLRGYLGLKGQWPELEAAFDRLAGTASLAEGRFFLHRDFQSKNIMVLEGRIGIVDWQGGRLGPLGYDVASLYVDPYPRLEPRHREGIYDCYISLLRGYDPARVAHFERIFPYLAIQRGLQIIGAFSHLSRVKNKPWFEAYIQPAVETLRALLARVPDPGLIPLKRLAVDLPC